MVVVDGCSVFPTAFAFPCVSCSSLTSTAAAAMGSLGLLSQGRKMFVGSLWEIASVWRFLGACLGGNFLGHGCVCDCWRSVVRMNNARAPEERQSSL